MTSTSISPTLRSPLIVAILVSILCPPLPVQAHTSWDALGRICVSEDCVPALDPIPGETSLIHPYQAVRHSKNDRLSLQGVLIISGQRSNISEARDCFASLAMTFINAGVIDYSMVPGTESGHTRIRYCPPPAGSLSRKFLDQTDFPEHTTLWDAVNYKTVSLASQRPYDSLNCPTFMG